jgi:hypothetical protein
MIVHLIPVVRRLGQEGHEFQASLAYIISKTLSQKNQVKSWRCGSSSRLPAL